jgi:MbtH protein
MNDNKDKDDGPLYKVVVNDEQQYSLWSAQTSPPPGWRETGVEGGRDRCLAHIRQVWTDMRPLSLRRAMGAD